MKAKLNISDRKSLKISVLLFIIAGSSILRWFYIKEPVFWDAGWTRMRPVHTAILIEDLYRKNYNILDMELNTRGGKAVYQQEFPVYNFLSALMFPVFGFDIKTAVVVSIFLYAVALLFIFLFFKEYLGDWYAIAVVLIAAFAPPTVVICRMIQQTSLNVLLIFMNLYFFRRYLDKPSWGRFFSSFAVLTLHLLVMSVFMIFGLVMLAIALSRKGIEPLKWAKTWILAVVPIIVCLLWYHYAQSTTGAHFPDEYIYHSSMNIGFAGLLSVFKVVLSAILSYISLPGLLAALIGLYFIRKNPLFIIVLAYIAAFAIFMIFYGHSLKVHVHYIPYYATIFAVPCIGFFQGIRKRISVRVFAVVIGFSLLYFVWHIFYILNTDFRMKAVGFLRPVAARIVENTEDDSNILFIGRGTKQYRREWEYATGRLGSHLPIGAAYETIQQAINLWNKPDYLAVVPWNYLEDRNMDKFAGPVRNKIFRQYMLRDSFLDEYMLFGLETPNSKLPDQKGFMRTEMRFANGLVLVGMLEDKLKGGKAYAFVWKKTMKVREDLYLVIERPDGKISDASHRIMSYAFPVRYWHKNSLYSEMVPSYDRFSRDNIDSYRYFLFDKKNRHIISREGKSIDAVKLDEISAKASAFFASEGRDILGRLSSLGLLHYSQMRTFPLN